MTLDKKQIWAIFLFKFKWVVKQWRQLSLSTMYLNLESAKEHTVQWWFKKFCKGDRSLEDEEHSGQLSEVDNDQLRAIMEANPLTQEVAEVGFIQQTIGNIHLSGWTEKKLQNISQSQTCTKKS